jgi:predicted Zn-dependent protease
LLTCIALTGQTFSRDSALGEQLANELLRSTPAIESPQIQGYVAQIGQKLAAQGASRGFPFRFTVVVKGDAKSAYEPISLPGGFVFVPTKLIIAAHDEAEFAGMLAQAIARQTPRFEQPGKIPLILVSGTASFLPSSALEQYRQVELDADQRAVAIMSRAGFDPEALVRYLDRVQLESGVRSPLPARSERIAALQRVIRGLPLANYSQSEEFYEIQEATRRIASR